MNLNDWLGVLFFHTRTKRERGRFNSHLERKIIHKKAEELILLIGIVSSDQGKDRLSFIFSTHFDVVHFRHVVLQVLIQSAPSLRHVLIQLLVQVFFANFGISTSSASSTTPR